MKYLKAYEGFDNKSPEGVKLYCHDLLAELRDEGFKTSVEVSGKWLEPLSMKNKSYVAINISKNIEVTESTLTDDINAFKWRDIKEYVDVVANYLSELGFKDMTLLHQEPGRKIVGRDAIRNPYDFSIRGIKNSCDLWYVRYEPEETNEELKSDVYKSAADKLIKIGHIKRPEELMKWHDVIKKREQDIIKKKSIEDAKQFGVYQCKLSFRHRIVNNRAEYKDFTGDFYLRLYYDSDQFSQNHDEDFVHDGGGMWLPFSFGIIPVNAEAEEYCQEIVEPINGLSRDGVTYWLGCFWLNLTEGNAPGDLTFKPVGKGYFECYEGNFDLANRKSAVQFKNKLFELFKGDIVLNETPQLPGGEKERIIDDLCNEMGHGIDEFEEIMNSIKKINLNKLYKD